MNDNNTNPLFRTAIRRFLIHTLASAAILGIIYAFAINTRLAYYFSPAIPWLLIFFVVIYNLVYYLQLKSTQSRSAKFVNIALLSTGFKLLLFMMILVAYALLNRDDAANFIIAFLILYFIFTSLEVISQQKAQRKLKGK